MLGAPVVCLEGVEVKIVEDQASDDSKYYPHAAGGPRASDLLSGPSFHPHFNSIDAHLESLADGHIALMSLMQEIQEDLMLFDARPGGKGEKAAEGARVEEDEEEEAERPCSPCAAPSSPCSPGQRSHASRALKSRDLSEATSSAQVYPPVYACGRPCGFFRQPSPALTNISVFTCIPHAMPEDTRDMLKKMISKRGIGQVQATTPAYKDDGWATSLVRHPCFGALSLFVIACNAVWLGMDTDLNKATLLVNAEMPYQVVENLFCTYFVMEWTIRFLSFREAVAAFRDAWFLFDTLLVVLMVLETWIVSAVVVATAAGRSNSLSLGNPSILKVLRLLRLTRVSRIIRLLRSLPELLFMLRGIAAATRSVGCTLGALMVTTYIYGIAFTQLSEGTDFGTEHFRTVPLSMYTLLLRAALNDSPTIVMDRIRKESFVCTCLFAMVILTSHLYLLNLLIGVLCHVVTRVSSKEKEDMDHSLVKDKLGQILMAGGLRLSAEEPKISKEDFLQLMKNEQALELLEKAGVDPVVLLDFADFLFQSDKFGRKFDRLVTFEEFVELIMKLRRGNAVALRDVAELRKDVRDECLALKVALSAIGEGQQKIETEIEQHVEPMDVVH